MTVKIDKGSALSTLSLTPLIDVVFLLLIFFLVATRFAEQEREIDVTPPQASEAKPLSERPDQLIVNIDRQGRYFVTGKVLGAEELYRVLRRACINNRHVPVLVRADKDCRWEIVAGAMNLCLKAGIHNVRPVTK